MLKLDNNLLDELGLGALPEDQKRGMLQHIYETLELRVGTNLANQMTDAQLQEFERFIDEGGDANQEQALHWLEANLPNYKQVVNDVFEALKIEVKAMAPQLLAASQQQMVAPQPSQQPQQNQQEPSHASPPRQEEAYSPPQAEPAGQGYSPSPQPQPAPTPYQFPTQQPPAGPSQQPENPSR
jgi:hypothetical protein